MTDLFHNLFPGISQFKAEKESREYQACSFILQDRKCFGRLAKQTPKKIGQFVTFWKREPLHDIEPFHEEDEFDYLLIVVKHQNKTGVFVFSKDELVVRNVLSTDQKEGKRGFRVYPSWDEPTSKQALKTQEWQVEHFYLLNDEFSFEGVI